jgi:hypothetical protein
MDPIRATSPISACPIPQQPATLILVKKEDTRYRKWTCPPVPISILCLSTVSCLDRLPELEIGLPPQRIDVRDHAPGRIVRELLAGLVGRPRGQLWPTIEAIIYIKYIPLGVISFGIPVSKEIVIEVFVRI